jgi:hypothetical protein
MYVGRITALLEDNEARMKFLHSSVDNSYDWPRRQDVTIIKTAFIFNGPLKLEGNGPFTISEIGEVKKMYKQMDKYKDVLFPINNDGSSD